MADDMVLAAEQELKATKEQIKALNRQARTAPTVEEQHQAQAKIRDLEKKKDASASRSLMWKTRSWERGTG